jgi:Zn-dependent peptidase ImmA (M78 family)
MPNFTVTDEIVSQIAEQYSFPIEQVKALKQFYDSFAKGMKEQYLAHIIRTMEECLRQVSENPLFRIICSPVDETSKLLGIAGAHYYKNHYFAIYYHPRTDEKQLRVLLAHELGHLFFIEMMNSAFNKQYDEKTAVEPLATIFGIFTIFDKNEFYHNKTAPFKHNSPEEILNDFKLLSNRHIGKYNTSESGD